MRPSSLWNWSLALASLALALPIQAADSTEQAAKAEPIKDTVWKNAPKKAITSAEIDELISKELKKAGIKPAPLTSDEQFIRRAYLDLWGKPPTGEEVLKFVADETSDKRAKLIDKLLDGNAFGEHWSRFWFDVMSAQQVSQFPGGLLARPFQRWLTESFNKNTPWNKMAADMLSASGEARFDDTTGKAGPAYFLGSHQGTEAVIEQAAETARVFLGIQINCAQCHDHPFDVWKREQFHELAAYFARVRSRLMRDPESTNVRFIGVNLASTDRGLGGRGGFGGRGRFGSTEHRMPDKDNPRASGTVMHPRWLVDGKAPSRNLKDTDRRKSLVESLTSKNNHWFAAAFVNRTWGVLLGQGFYLPVDDMGPQREAVHGETLARVAANFAATDYDIKKLFRTIMNTQTYQRQSRVGKSTGEHLLFAASYPTRLRPAALVASLNNTVGSLGGFGGGGRRGGFGGRFGGGGIEGMIRSEFGFNPSLKNDDVEGSIPQSLILMNNPQLNQKIKSTGSTRLARILEKFDKDEAALTAVYLTTLSRKPTSKELIKCADYIKKVGKRGEAFEDIQWALINSTEFQTRR